MKKYLTIASGIVIVAAAASALYLLKTLQFEWGEDDDDLDYEKLLIDVISPLVGRD